VEGAGCCLQHSWFASVVLDGWQLTVCMSLASGSRHWRVAGVVRHHDAPGLVMHVCGAGQQAAHKCDME
jgi:hypothetical protein